MKLERIISMIYMLLNNEILSASALAQKYNVSQRTIYRDIDVICAAGIPVVSYQGVNGGFGIIKDYKMEKSLLGSYDVGSLVTLLSSMSTVFEDEKAKETIHKLQTIQHEQESPVLSMNIGSQKLFNDPLRLLRAAITESCVVRFKYINARNEKTERIVEPVRLIYEYDVWYLFGYCRDRKEYRKFRLSRMAELKATGEHFLKHKHAAPQDVEFRQLRNQGNPVKAIIHFSEDSLAKAMDYFYGSEKTYNEDGSFTLTITLEHVERMNWLVPVLLSFGDGAEVIEPPELREAIKDKLVKMIKRYSKV